MSSLFSSSLEYRFCLNQSRYSERLREKLRVVNRLLYAQPASSAHLLLCDFAPLQGRVLRAIYATTTLGHTLTCYVRFLDVFVGKSFSFWVSGPSSRSCAPKLCKQIRALLSLHKERASSCRFLRVLGLCSVYHWQLVHTTLKVMPSVRLSALGTAQLNYESITA